MDDFFMKSYFTEGNIVANPDKIEPTKLFLSKGSQDIPLFKALYFLKTI